MHQLTPSAALLKAMLINSAKSVTDAASVDEKPCKAYAKGLLIDICVPNYQEGFGRPNIGSVSFLVPPHIVGWFWRVDECVGWFAGWVGE